MKRQSIIYPFILGFLCFSTQVRAGEMPIFKPVYPVAEVSTGPHLEGQVDPYYAQHVEYAKYLYKDKWAERLPDLMGDFKQTMASNKPENINSVLAFNNFLAFIKAVDGRMGLHYSALNGYLKDAQFYNEQMRQASLAHKGDDLENSWSHLYYDVTQMNRVLTDAREPLLKAISIYKVPVKEIDSSNPTFKSIGSDFYKGVIESVKKLASQVPAQNNPFKDEDITDMYELDLYMLIKNSSFTYSKVIIIGGSAPIQDPGNLDPGNIGFVSFVNFGSFAFNKWGTYGGDGALNAAAFELLDF